MHGRNVFRALGLSLLAALGLMAFAAGGAQGANLVVTNLKHGGIVILGSDTLEASVTGKAEGEGRLLVPALGIEITCKKFTVIEGLVNQTAALGHGIAQVLFEECKVYAINAALELTSKTVPPTALPCQPLDSEKGTVGHIRAIALVLAVLHENDAKGEQRSYIVFEQLNLGATPLSLIHFTPGMGCPLPLKPTVGGTVAFEVTVGDLHNGGKEVKEILIKDETTTGKATQTLLGAKLLYGINESFIDGSALLSLSDEKHLGCTWGIL